MKKLNKFLKSPRKVEMNYLKKSSLLSFEKDVLRLLFKDMSENKDEISSSEMTKWCRSNSSTIQHTISDLNKQATSWLEKTHFKIYEPRSLKESAKFLVVLFTYFVFVFGVLFFTRMIPFEIVFIMTSFLIVFPLAFVAVWAIESVRITDNVL